MKKIFNPFLMIVMALSPTCFTAVGAANAKDIRKPVYAGSFYPDTPEELTAIIKQLVNQVKPITSLFCKRWLINFWLTVCHGMMPAINWLIIG